MKTTAMTACVGIFVGVAGLGFVYGQSFDRLSDADRAVFAKRFEREIWPLLVRNGKDGCVGCHGAGHESALRFSGQVQKDFRMLLKEGFFLYKDPGTLYEHVATTNERLRMPPGKRERWAEKEIKLLGAFTLDVHKKQMP